MTAASGEAGSTPSGERKRAQVPIITVSSLSKTYRIPRREPGLRGAVSNLLFPRSTLLPAIQDLDFTIEAGEVVAYLGPNGAGKSTTIKLLTGILTPSAGRVEVLGLEPYSKRIENARNIGVVFGQRSQLRWDLPVIESFELHRRLYGLSASFYRDQMDLFSSTLDLGGQLGKSARSLSLGQKMLCNIALSLLHRPPIIYLDEPTIGLDIVVKEKIRDFFVHLNREHGVSIVLTSHDLEDVEKLCERVMVIDKGRILFDGGLEELRGIYGKTRIMTLELADSPRGLDGLHDVTEVDRQGNRIRVQFDGSQLSTTRLITEIAAHNEVRDVVIQEQEIGTIVRRLYQERAAAD